MQNLDEAVCKPLGKQDWPSGERTASTVGRYLEEEHVRRLSNLLRLQREEKKQQIMPVGKPHEENEDVCMTQTLSREDLAVQSNKHHADLQSELALQYKEREDLVEEQLQLQEEQAIREGRTGDGKGDIGAVVCRIQLSRHLRQYILLDQRLKKQQQECREAPRYRVEQWLTVDDDAGMKLLCNQAEGQHLALMDLKSVIALLELRGEKLQEFADTLKSFTSDKCVEEAEHMVAELKGFRQARMKELQEQLQNINGKRCREKEIREMAVKEEIEELEASLAKEDKIAEEIIAQELLKKRQRQNLRMMEEEAKFQDQLERGEMTLQLREKLIKEHGESLQLQDTGLRQEIAQIKRNMVARRKGKRADSLRRIAERKVAEEQKEEARHSQQVQQVLNEATKTFEQMASFVALNVPVFLLRPRATLVKDSIKMVLQSPLFKLLSEINEHLRADPEVRVAPQDKEERQETDEAKAYYQGIDSPCIDIVDAGGTCEGNLMPLGIEKLSETELDVYRFGIFIAQLVTRMINAPDINLLLASSLPMNNYTRNTFRNYFYYQHSRKELFIRRQQLASVGDFSLLLVHCLAHLAAGELRDDSNPLFLKFFHQALKGIFKETFFLRLCVSPTLHAHDDLFQNEDCPEVNLEAIPDLLNVKLRDPESLTGAGEQDRETRDDNRVSTQLDKQGEKTNEEQYKIEKSNE
ncbi:uncharacterized protein LOC144608639 [Rhinoraja longicauda]